MEQYPQLHLGQVYLASADSQNLHGLGAHSCIVGSGRSPLGQHQVKIRNRNDAEAVLELSWLHSLLLLDFGSVKLSAQDVNLA